MRRPWCRRCAPAARAACWPSGGFLSFANPIAEAVGFDRVKANRRCSSAANSSGEVGDPIVDAMSKQEALIEAREQLGLKREDVLAVGDGANDKLMIEEAGLGIAYKAKPALAEAADAELRHHGLDASAVGAGGAAAGLVPGVGPKVANVHVRWEWRRDLCPRVIPASTLRDIVTFDMISRSPRDGSEILS